MVVNWLLSHLACGLAAAIVAYTFVGAAREHG